MADGSFARRHRWTLVAVAFAGLDLSRHLFVGWVPHDEGTLALTGALVRQGLWPHRDFVDVYSGGIALLSAGTQLLLGDDLRALRYPLFIAALGWVALLAACLRRFVAPKAAAALALLAFLWGPPLYPAPMPSWYLLFTATGVLWCVLRWTESDDHRWLAAAGAGIGVALLLKINGLFLLAGVGTFLLADRRPAAVAREGAGRAGNLVRAVGLGLGVAGIVTVVLGGWPARLAAPLLLPIATLGVAGIVRQWSGPGSLRGLVADLGGPVVALTAGIVAVTLPFIIPYVVTGATGSLVDGVFVLPFRRAISASLLPTALKWKEVWLFLVVVVACSPKVPRHWSLLFAVAVVAAGLRASWWGHSDDPSTIRDLWRIARTFLVGGLLLAAWAGLRRGAASRPLLAVAALVAWFACIQYPFAAPVYFAYVAPLAVIVLAATASAFTLSPAVPSAVALVALVVTLTVNHGQGINTLGLRHLPQGNATLDLPRGGLEVPVADAESYRGVSELLDRWGARRIVAAPDSPEIYYLTGRPMVGRELYEFTAPEWSAEVLARRIVEARSDAAVLKTAASFSPVPVDSVVGALGPRVSADTIIGGFRLLRLAGTDASP